MPVHKEGDHFHETAGAGTDEQRSQKPGIQVFPLADHMTAVHHNQGQKDPYTVCDNNRLKIQNSSAPSGFPRLSIVR
jgi:hypothetical protein